MQPDPIYRLRLRRKRLLLRAKATRRQLQAVCTTGQPACGPQPILLFLTMRNERVRLPYFLEYYRKLGVDHFLIVDNGSDDGTREYLAEQPDVSLWTTAAGLQADRASGWTG